MKCLLIALALATAAAAAPAGYRTVAGQGVRFDIPAGAAKSHFTPDAEGRMIYATAANVKGVEKIRVTVEPRPDPDATLMNELTGAEAGARTANFKKSRVNSIAVAGTRGVEGLARADGKSVAHLVTWSVNHQFTLELIGEDPLDHAAWKRLLSSFRFDDKKIDPNAPPKK